MSRLQHAVLSKGESPRFPGVSAGWRSLHGVLLVVCMGLVIPLHSFQIWPWVWLIPLVLYGVPTLLIPPLRRSCAWLHFGTVTRNGVIAAVGIAGVSSLTLILFHRWLHPDLRELVGTLPIRRLGGLVPAGVIFSFGNAVMEELIFRGILHDSLASQWGEWFALVCTSCLFGLGHLHGFPPGAVGAMLAAIFGGLLGSLRIYTGGLALPVLAHVVADATIFSILTSSGIWKA